MKRFKHNEPVTAADESPASEAFEDGLSQLEDDFDFAISGLEKLSADGYPADAKDIAETLSASIDSAIASISAILS